MDKILEKALEKVENYIDHHKNLDKDLNDLKSEFEVLKRRKIDVDSEIKVKVRLGQVLRKEVRGWLKDFQKTKKEMQHLEEWVSRVPRYERANLNKLVREKIEEVKRIQERGIFNQGLVIEKALPTGIVIPIENLEGEISTKDEIWEHLMGSKVGMIGVCGIGGVGKTTIMKHVNNDLLRENRFQFVIWVTVSHPFNVFEVQRKIAGAMGERLPEDKEVMIRAATLMEIMRKVSFVLILDDVWEKFFLKDVGIPEPVQNGCKVVITSRSIEVCNHLHCEIVKVQPLLQEESLKLFLNTVGDDVLQVSGLEDILKLIVKECAGLPLAIVVIAASMRGVDDVNVWRNALTELQDRVKAVSGWDAEIFQRLRFSYDRLDRLDIKKCFLYCSLFREDYEFPRTELIEGWIDDGLIDIGDFGSRQKAYDRGHAFLDKLVKNCLIEKTVYQYKFEDVFKMHDVVRDMAINSIGPEFGFMVKELREVQKEHGWAKDVRKLSLMAIHISKLPVGLSLKCPTLSTLILSNTHLSEIPNSIFEDMGALEVLDLSCSDIEVLPVSISNLENLTALRLSWCRRLKYLPSLEKLRALKKLDLIGTGIKVVPQGIEMLECLEYLDLCCGDLKEIPTGILSKLSRLQYLVAAVDFGEETSVKINSKELARLRKLEILKCDFDDMQDYNYFVSESNFQSLTTYKLTVGRWNKGRYNGHLEHKSILKFSGCDIGKECIVLPDKLQHLGIYDCKNMRSSLNKIAWVENATELSLCEIKSCREIEYVVELDSSSSSLCCPILAKLEWLSLWHLPRLCALIRVEGGSTPPGVFFNLKNLDVIGCSGMRKLLPLELLQTPQNLETIRVVNCEQMEEIIASSNSDASLDKFTFTFPKLRLLTLVNLPQLKSICSAKGVMACDSIEQIWIRECPKLKRIPVQLPLLENGQPSPPPRLRRIYIERWGSVEWDHPNAKNLLRPFFK